MTVKHYNRDGDEINFEDWIKVLNNNQVRRDTVDGVLVSTVHLGIDHSFGGGPPLIFETMVFFDGDDGEYQWRYSTLEAAQRGHETILEGVRNRVDLYDLEVSSV